MLCGEEFDSPQGPKATVYYARSGTAEAVPDPTRPQTSFSKCCEAMSFSADYREEPLRYLIHV